MVVHSPFPKRDCPATATLEETLESAENELNTTLLRAQRSLESHHDDRIREVIAHLKTAWRPFEDASRALTNRHRQQGCTNEANLLLKTRLQLRTEDVNPTIASLNAVLADLGQDACSSIHATSSVYQLGVNDGSLSIPVGTDRVQEKETHGLAAKLARLDIHNMQTIQETNDRATGSGENTPGATPGDPRVSGSGNEWNQRQSDYLRNEGGTSVYQTSRRPADAPITGGIDRRNEQREVRLDEESHVTPPAPIAREYSYIIPPNRAPEAHPGRMTLAPPNVDYGRPIIETFTQVQLRQELLRGLKEQFTGEIELYWNWKETIKSRLLEIDATDSIEIQVLRANTQGRPHEIIRDLTIAGTFSPKTVVDNIWRDLDNRYGSEIRLTNHLFGKLHSFPKIKSPSQIEDIERLRSIGRHMEASAPRCTSLEVMNYPQSQIRLWDKMPDAFIKRWRNKSANKVLPLSVLLKEIDDFITEFSDPVFAIIPSAPRVLRTELDSPPDAANSLTAGAPRRQDTHRGTQEDPRWSGPTSPGRETCVLHPNSQSHPLTKCTVFQKMGVISRRDVVQKFKLCFLCLGDHFQNRCRSGSRCEKCG